jgi:PPM family protein phosphatase
VTPLITSAAQSDIGVARPGNEDSGYAGRWLFAVADGMGGHAAGEVASTIAITTVARYDIPEPPERLAAVLGAAVREANDAIRKHAEDHPSTRTMGTTLTAMLWSGHTFALAHIGDSRAYRLRNGQFRQLTEDHALGHLVGNAPPVLAPLISRYLDGRPDRSPDLMIREAATGDRYLLCSDGLTSVVPDDALRDELASASHPQQIIGRLVDLANSLGGPDNTTVVLIDVDAGSHGIAPPPGLVGAAAPAP